LQNTGALAATLKVLIKMAQVVITFRIMPEGPDTNLEAIEKKASKIIAEFGGEVGKSEKVPVAFGISSLNLIFIMDESIGSTETLEKDISGIEGVNSVEVVDVRRAVG